MGVGIWDFKAKRGRDSGLKVCAGCGMPKITSGITGLCGNLIGIRGLSGNLSSDYGIEQKFWDAITGLKNPIRDLQSKRDCQLYVQ